jgi:hypothetical protein
VSTTRTSPEARIEDALLALRAARGTHEREPHLVTEAVVIHYQRKLDELLEQYPRRGTGRHAA